MRDWMQYVKENLPPERFQGETEVEVREEIADHLEETFQEALRGGATEAEAEATALLEVKDWERLARAILKTPVGAASSRSAEVMEATERSLRRRGGPWMPLADLIQELRLALRRLRKAPAFTAVVLATLGVGIGATTAIFSVVKGVLLDPLPYEDADRLVAVANTAPGLGEDRLPQSMAVNAVYEDDAQAFEAVGLWYPQTVTLHSGGAPEEIPAVAVTTGTLPALRVQPVMGRLFDQENMAGESYYAVILSHHFWVDRMGGDPDAVGKTLDIGTASFEVIGVLPRGFRLMDRDPDLYLPLFHDRSDLTVSNFVFQSLGRLREGVSLEGARAELTRLIPLAPERYPGGMTVELLREAEGAPVLFPLKDEVVGGVREVLWVVLAGVGIILLVACANVANLLLVRAESRQRALAMQSALGAPRARTVAFFLAESTLLGIMGGLLGTGLAYAGLRVLRAAGPGELPRLHEIGLDPGVLIFALGVSLLAGLALGILPLVRSWRSDLISALREGGRGLGGSRSRYRARNTLVVTQLALAMVLLVGSGLMIRSFASLLGVQPGYADPEEVLTFRFFLGSQEVPDLDDVPGAFEALAQRISGLPGVTAVGLSSSIPMDGRAGFDPVFVEDFPLPEGQQAQIRRFKWIGGGYLEAMGNRVIAGRAIDWVDIRERSRVVMITEGLAREFWDDPARAVGRRISTGYGPGDWREVVGVVGDVRDDGLDRDPVDIVYWPMAIDGYWSETRGDAPFITRGQTIVVRSSRVGTPGFLEELRDLVWAFYPDRPLGSLRTMESIQAESMARTSFTLVMLGIASLISLLLGAIGIYGVISYAVGQRTQELGLRMAMGAEPGNVTGMVLRQAMVLGVVGMTAGLGAAAVATRFMEAVLFGVGSIDPLTYAVVSGILAGVVLLASYLPARRAASIDPTEALRWE